LRGQPEATRSEGGASLYGRYNLGNLYTALNEPQEAVRNYEAALKIDDLFYPAKVNLAMLYNSRGENEKAEKLFREVVAKHPELYDVAYSLGLLLQALKRDPQAEASLQKALALEPANMDYLYALADFYLKGHRFTDARKVAERMVAEHPNQRMGREILELIERRLRNQ